MATDRAAMLLEKSEPFLKPCDPTEVLEAGEAKVMTAYLMDCRRKQIRMFQQLSMLDDVLKLIAGLDSAEEFLNEPCPPFPDTNASAPWKALKAQYLEEVQEVEALISTLAESMDALLQKRQKLEALVSAMEKKLEECKEQERAGLQRQQRTEKQLSLQLEDSLQTAQNALSSCNKRLAELKSQVEGKLKEVANLTSIRDRLQEVLEVTQSNMQYKLLSVTPTELCLELLPHNTQSLKPLQISVTMTTNDCFSLQVFQGTAGLVEESIKGPKRELSAALLEVMQRYISQGEMLSEIQALHSRYAIDWCPAKRLLVFLKTASTVCHLELDEGYPSNGYARLLSVRKDGNLIDLSTLQPPVMNPTLTNWLEFLSFNPDF